MSRMAELHMELVELIDQGYSPISIAAMTNLPLTTTQDFYDAVMEDMQIAKLGTEYDESEFESA